MPGRSWKGIAEALLKLMPPMVIADLGAGEGTISQLMAQRAKRVIAVDNSEKMVEVGSELARKQGFANLEYRLGDLEDVPIRTATVDLAFLSQALHHARHPDRAMAEAWRILKPGGRIRDSRSPTATTSKKHARDVRRTSGWDFTEAELDRLLRAGGFKNTETAVVYREQEPPYLETVLATGEKPSGVVKGPAATRSAQRSSAAGVSMGEVFQAYDRRLAPKMLAGCDCDPLAGRVAG